MLFAPITALDMHIETALDTTRSPWAISFWSWLTTFGDARTITIVSIAFAFVLWRHRRFAYKAGFAVALFGSLAASYALKLVIERPRPPHPLAAITEPGYSFPSMHATVSMAAYGFVVFAIWTIMRPRSHRAPAALVLAALILMIGFSRVYLGVHYTSDVLGGYLVGAVFLFLGIRVTRALSAKGRGASRAAPSARGARSRPA